LLLLLLLFNTLCFNVAAMESHTIQVLLDQARAELEAAERREREKETELRILHSATKGRRDAVRVLDRELGYAQQVRNIRI
jgi:outer membrane protein TolC